jgi:hypothetical protein
MSDGATGDGATGKRPIVVASFGEVPASLALDGDALYVTIAETSAGHDGKVVSVPKGSTGATSDAGTVTTLATGLTAPRAIAVNGTDVYWADTETVFPDNPSILAVPTSGGTVREVLSNVTTLTRFPIAGSTLYTITANLTSIASFPLSAEDAGGLTTIYPGTLGGAVAGVDGDGTTVFFFGKGTTNLDLYSQPAAGGALKDLAKNAAGGSFDFTYLVDDATTLYWSDSGTGKVFSLPKTGGTPKILETFMTGSAPVQLVLDGNDVYALDGTELVRFPKSGGTPVVLATALGTSTNTFTAGFGNAIQLAVDDTFVYWLYEAHGEVLKLAK